MFATMQRGQMLCLSKLSDFNRRSSVTNQLKSSEVLGETRCMINGFRPYRLGYVERVENSEDV